MTRHIIDLSTLSPTQGFVIQGDAAGDEAGRSVSNAGDTNGDGFGDVIVGAFYGDDGSSDAGEAYVVFGGADGFGTKIGGRQVVDLTTLSAAQGFVIQGDSAFDWAGWSVSAAGDANGDGFADVIVGAPQGDGHWAGEAYLVFGGAWGFGTAVDGRQVVDLTTLSSAQGFVIQGDANYDQAGYSVSAAGDVNGDGFDDLIVGAWGGDDGGYNSGDAYVLFGRAGGFGTAVDGRQVVDLTTLSGAQGFIIQGDWAFDGAGSSVSAAGDVNGDGFADVVVGAPDGDDGGSSAGEAYVLFGGAGDFGTAVDGRQVVDLTTLSPARGFIIQGDVELNRTGWSVSDAGDVNGDGFGDVIVGAPLGDDGGRWAGEAYVVFGGNSGFGTPDANGRQVVDLTMLTAARGFIIQGDASFDGAGESVSAAGDVNGDGFDDLIVGARNGDDGGYDAGEAYVVFGGNFTHAVANVGTDGDDVIDSGPAGQIIFGAQGEDTLNGNRGDDSLNGGSGDDSLNGGADGDTIAGGSGDDSAVGGRGDDRALGGDGDETLSGRAGNDRLAGEANADSLAGNAGNDRLDGGQGTDVLAGGDGADTLLGGGRGDVLIGGAGADVLTGGTGGDRFVFAAGASSVGAPDIVTDFRHGFDMLVIRSGHDTGTLLGGGAFTGGGGIEVRYDTNLHQLQADLNGDGALGSGDLAIDGASLATLTAQDLLFV